MYDAKDDSVLSYFLPAAIYPSFTSSYNAAESLSSWEMVIWTCGFCLALTIALVVGCHLYPPSELELMLDVNSIPNHIQSLKSNRKTLQKVSVKGFEDFDEGQLLPIIHEIAGLPSLQAFSVDLLLPVNLLTYLLRGAHKLQSLSIYFQLRGNKGEIETLAESMKKHPSLKAISIESCTDESDLDRNFDPLVRAIADISTLETLSIYNLHASSQSFSRLLRSPYIHSMELSCTTALSCHQVKLLANNTSLQTLITPLHSNTETAWGDMLRHNHSLQKLVLVLEQSACAMTTNNHHGDNQSKLDRFLPVARALAENSSLQSLSLDVNENMLGASMKGLGVSLECLQEIATSLLTNTNLKTLTISRCQVRLDRCSPAVQSLIQSLNQNYTLEAFELILDGSKCFKIPEIDFFLRCNKLGRKQILKFNKSGYFQVIDFVIQNQSDISTTFHILREKPEVMQQATLRQKCSLDTS